MGVEREGERQSKRGGGRAIGSVEQRLMRIGNKVTLRRGEEEEPGKE